MDEKVKAFLADKQCSYCEKAALDCDVFFPMLDRCGECVGKLTEKQQKRFIELVIGRGTLAGKLG